MTELSGDEPRVPATPPGDVPVPPTDPGQADLLLIILVGIVWGSAFPVIRAGLVAGAPPLLFASLRYLLTAAALVPLALWAKTPFPSTAELRSPALFGGLLMIGAYGGLLYIGEESTSGGLAAILTASAALASALFAYWLLPKERFGRLGTLGLLVGFGGVGVLFFPQLSQPFSSGLKGPLLVLAAVMAFALGSVLLRRTSSASPTFWSLSVQFLIAGGLLGTVAIALGEPFELGQGPTVPLALAFLVFFAGILGYTLYFRVHHSSGPARANVVGYVNPVSGVIVGFLLLGENVTALEVGGMALVALGLYLLQRDRS